MINSVEINFDNSYIKLPENFYSKICATPVKQPKLLIFNKLLATDLGIAVGTQAKLAEVFSGNKLIEGSDPIAQVYAGHQFGHYTPQLGDGRAILLGEIIAPNNSRWDIQLKGSGKTPYSRNGDGRAWLGPVLREYIVSEAMHSLGVPTTRSLAAVLTGETVIRDEALPGAILTRVAASHIRVGTFQFFYARKDIKSLRNLLDYTIERHFPNADGPSGLLDNVIDLQTKLITKWMSVGFIHGVMNTDNCQIAGETIDYGPCAFMDKFDPMQVYSSIDYMGRYAYENQSKIILWNMAQFATALVVLMPDANEAISSFNKKIQKMNNKLIKSWERSFAAKIGISNPDFEDVKLIKELLSIMASQKADFTNTFRFLGTAKAREEFSEPIEFDKWEQKWSQRIKLEISPLEKMANCNPSIIPRNHKIEEVIQSALQQNYKPFERLLAALTKPFRVSAQFEDFCRPPSKTEEIKATFCGT